METDTKKKVVIYCRAAMDISSVGDSSLSIQEAECRKYAVLHCYEVTGVFGECASGLQFKRSALQQLLTYCANRENGIEIVITKNPARLSRSNGELERIELLLYRDNIEIRYVEIQPAGIKENLPKLF